MTLSYFDTSAAFKLAIEERETGQLKRVLAEDRNRTLTAAWLLHTELHCAAGRHAESIERRVVDEILEAVTLVELTRGDMIAAGAQAPLRAADALHLTVALRLGVDEIFTYDNELAEAAGRAGLLVVSPG